MRNVGDCLMMREKLCRNVEKTIDSQEEFLIVQTATQSRLRREKHQVVSDGAIVVLTLCESREERRVPVIQLKYFVTTTPVAWEEDERK